MCVIETVPNVRSDGSHFLQPYYRPCKKSIAGQICNHVKYPDMGRSITTGHRVKYSTYLPPAHFPTNGWKRSIRLPASGSPPPPRYERHSRSSRDRQSRSNTSHNASWHTTGSGRQVLRGAKLKFDILHPFRKNGKSDAHRSRRHKSSRSRAPRFEPFNVDGYNVVPPPAPQPPFAIPSFAPNYDNSSSSPLNYDVPLATSPSIIQAPFYSSASAWDPSSTAYPQRPHKDHQRYGSKRDTAPMGYVTASYGDAGVNITATPKVYAGNATLMSPFAGPPPPSPASPSSIHQTMNMARPGALYSTDEAFEVPIQPLSYHNKGFAHGEYTSAFPTTSYKNADLPHQMLYQAQLEHSLREKKAQLHALSAQLDNIMAELNRRKSQSEHQAYGGQRRTSTSQWKKWPHMSHQQEQAYPIFGTAYDYTKLGGGEDDPLRQFKRSRSNNATKIDGLEQHFKEIRSLRLQVEEEISAIKALHREAAHYSQHHDRDSGIDMGDGDIRDLVDGFQRMGSSGRSWKEHCDGLGFHQSATTSTRPHSWHPKHTVGSETALWNDDAADNTQSHGVRPYSWQARGVVGGHEQRRDEGYRYDPYQ